MNVFNNLSSSGFINNDLKCLPTILSESVLYTKYVLDQNKTTKAFNIITDMNSHKLTLFEIKLGMFDRYDRSPMLNAIV